MSSRFIHVVANSKISFFPVAEKYFIVSIFHIFFIHPSIYEHLGNFHALAIVHNATVSMGLQISFWDTDFVFFRWISTNGIAGSCGSLLLIFQGTSLLFSIVAPPIYVLANSAFLSTSWPSLVISCLFDDSYPTRCEMKSHCAFDCIFLMSSFSWTCWPLYVFFRKMSVKLLCPFFKLDCLVFAIEFNEFLYIFGY